MEMRAAEASPLLDDEIAPHTRGAVAVYAAVVLELGGIEEKPVVFDFDLDRFSGVAGSIYGALLLDVRRRILCGCRECRYDHQD